MISIAHAIAVGMQGGGASAPETALDHVAASAVLSYHRADLGITLNGSNVSAWADQSGNAHNYAQGTAGAQPAYQVTGGPNSTAGILFDGTDDLLVNTTLAFPSPSTTPTMIWMVVEQVSWTNNDTLIGANSATLAGLIYQVTASPQIVQYSGSNGTANSGLTVGSPKRVYAYYDNVGDNRLKAAGTTATMTGIVGTNSATGRTIGGRQAANFANMRIMELLYMNRDFTGSEESDLDAYVTSRYGAGLVA